VPRKTSGDEVEDTPGVRVGIGNWHESAKGIADASGDNRGVGILENGFHPFFFFPYFH
jgi:hypothetical protein